MNESYNFICHCQLILSLVLVPNPKINLKLDSGLGPIIVLLSEKRCIYITRFADILAKSSNRPLTFYHFPQCY